MYKRKAKWWLILSTKYSKEESLLEHESRSFLGRLWKYISVILRPNNRISNLASHNQQVIKLALDGTVSNYCCLTTNLYDVNVIDTRPCILKQQSTRISVK